MYEKGVCEVMWPLDHYIEWVRRNEAFVSAAENMTRGLSFLFANPASLISMEGTWTVTKLHALSNRMIISTAGRQVHRAEQLSWLMQGIREVECLVEIALRHLRHHRAGWLFVVGIEILKTLLRFFIHKRRLSTACRTLSGLVLLLQSLVASRAKSAATAASVTGFSLTRPKSTTSLIIPRVQTSRVAVAVPSLSDIAASIVDLYVLLRPLLLAASAFASFPAKRLLLQDRFAFSAAAPTSVRSLKVSLSPSWGVWRLFVAADLAALLGAHLVRKYRAPIIVADGDDAMAAVAEPELGSADASTAPTDATEDDKRVSAIGYTLVVSIFRDPFFSVVLKESVFRHLVDGRVNRWVPLLGPLLANQMRYWLSMQQHSFLYSMQS